MCDRADDYLRFARDPRAPFDNEAERVIRTSKLRIKVSGVIRPEWLVIFDHPSILDVLGVACGQGAGALFAVWR